MPANAWELRADVRPLEAAAVRWEELSTLMTRRGDEIVTAARRATEGWDAEAAESYDNHRRQVLVNLDRFTTLALQIAGSLRGISAIITAAQVELDQSWAKVALIPHEVVGESRYLVFRPSEDDDRGKVTSGEQETGEIRRRMSATLDQESGRLRTARAEFVMVRTELKTLAGGFFPAGTEPGEDVTGVGSVPPASASTSVPGSAQAGIAALPPIGPISVSMPDLQGVSGNVAPFVASAAGGLLGRRGDKKPSSGTPPMGGMGAGAMGARAGTMSRGMASGRSGPTRLATPKLEGQAGARGTAAGGSGGSAAEDEATRVAREKEAAKEAKRAALEEKRAERAARKAEREQEKDEEKKRFDGVPTEEVTVGSDAEADDELGDELGEELDTDAGADGGAEGAADREGRTTAETGSEPRGSRR
ncbi:hypothetical protein SAMN04489844_0955 [Nocardioides exalbidus]|uniref:Uncharacterized protein n=1 Tax=Nocardioides exalbidus TaxID=402596 RepID=A0A1H4LT46_9ACTN|nr:hypothetical protein [Nocardioides exalbidus]SEB73754.1 hypothetical protein SAMN04489844_0955 [Nocardioides exalbidus]